ncbi:hypothetical protein [Sporosarcina gallistercoris]|uniref:Uncharacterized protein n=1 Tax=Sporosarcina gallistercoris TaxID=2762245 RepID=A0ABR8PJ82_9BACL|nr:hypothetical protein [Sporosarcina gallistercoris]MBD7908139.1 hypothetical protein [Sporosarcina gallistercoris]
MGILLIIFIALGAAGLLLQGLMYTKQFNLNLGIRVLNTVLGLIIAYITFTSFPEGETIRKSIAAALGISAVVGLAISLMQRKALVGRLLLTLSVLVGLGFLYVGM